MDTVTEKVMELSDYLLKDQKGNPVVPVNLEKILQKYDLKAFNANFSEPTVSGAFDRSKREIYVDATDPYVRKIFTLAHELGHYFLHENVRDTVYREKTSKNKSQMEREADEFAAELLMPESTIRAYWSITRNVQQLADIFSVSYLAMTNRLRKLGFI